MDFSPVIILNLGLMAMLICVAFAVVRMRSLFAIVMLQGVYSLLSAAWFVSLDAVDVAFTEAAVGAGISTVLMLSAMLLTDREAKPIPVHRKMGPLLIVIIAGVAMFYAIGDMPAYGDALSPANAYVGAEYIETTKREIFIPNVVTAVLASFRGFDTFGETVVIFMAGLGIMLLLGLDGKAGQWRAQPNGRNICSSGVVPERKRTPEEIAKLAAKKAKKPTRKASTKTKTKAASNAASKKATSKVKGTKS